jgi:hypothetical protein
MCFKIGDKVVSKTGWFAGLKCDNDNYRTIVDIVHSLNIIKLSDNGWIDYGYQDIDHFEKYLDIKELRNQKLNRIL